MSMALTKIHFALIFAFLISSGWVVCQNRALDCSCTDVDPRFGADKHLKFVRARCWEHLKDGECGRGFMFNTVQELPEGFCQITCGRCDCCRTMRSVAEDEGLNDWLWAIDAARLGDVDEPGWEVSVLAPRDGSVDELLDRLGGWSRSDVERDDAKRKTLRDVLLYNMISPLPDHWAVYTSPFFTEGLSLDTEAKGSKTLTVRAWDEASIGFQGPANSATVNSDGFDRASCKGFLHITDQFVLPSGDDVVIEAVTATEDIEAADPVETDACVTVEGTEYDGEMLDTVKADHAEDCCSKCSAMRECNVWTYCARETGCHNEEETPVWWGDCQLKSSISVSQGGDPTSLSSGVSVPYQSGHINKSPAQVAG